MEYFKYISDTTLSSYFITQSVKISYSCRKRLCMKFTLLSYLFLIIPFTTFSENSEVIIAGGDHYYPPYEFINKKGEPDGFNIEIVKAVSQAMGLSIDIKLGVWLDVREKLNNEEIDMLAGMFYTPERDKLYDFSIPHFIASYAVFVRKDSKIKNFEDVHGTEIILHEGDMAHDHVLNYRITDKIITKTNMDEVLKALAAGEGDCAIVTRLQGLIILKDNNINSIKTVGAPILQRKYCIVVKKGNSELLAQINEGLSIIKLDGTYDKIHSKWFDIYEDKLVLFREVLIILLFIITPLIVIIFTFILWNLTLKRNVHKKTEELKKANDYISNIFDSMPSSLYGIRRDGIINKCNLKAKELLNMEYEEIIGRSIYDILPEAEIKKELVDESIRKKQEKIFNKKIEISGSEVKSLNITIYPLISGNSDEAVIRIDDITPQFELTQQLNQSRKMEAIGRLAGGIAHDFNNMLGGIINAAQLLQHRAKAEGREEKYIEMIISASKRAAELTGKLLAFGRKGKTELTPVNIERIINDTIEIMERTIDKKIKILSDIKSSNAMTIGNESLLQNSFINICINASKAMPQGGVLAVSLSDVYLNENDCRQTLFRLKPGKYIKIDFTDTGCGIPEENLDKIFEPFFTTREKGEGIGLGLSAVYGTIQDHNGAVSAVSTVSKGTTFTILLPLAEGVTEAEQKTPASVKGSGVIMLVDDEPIIRVTAKAILEELNYTVFSFNNGNDALSYYKDSFKGIDIIIIDYIMPDINGEELFHKIKEINSSAKVILSSGLSDDISIESLKKEGLSGFIRKPYSYSDLSKLLSEQS